MTWDLKWKQMAMLKITERDVNDILQNIFVI